MSELYVRQVVPTFIPLIVGIYMNSAERFQHLSDAYRLCARTAFDNLVIIKQQQQRNVLTKVFAKSPLDQMKSFRLGPVRTYLTTSDGGKACSMILGEFTEQMAFSPSITERILNIHGVANLVNAALKTKKVASELALVRPLQEALLDFYFLEKTFSYYASKAKLIDGNLENMIQKKAEQEDLVKSYYQSFVAGIDEMVQACIDVPHLNAKIKQYKFTAYSWISQELGADGKAVNDYLLPREYWEPYIKHFAAEQAKAMAR